jgi:hypothetical protein
MINPWKYHHIDVYIDTHVLRYATVARFPFPQKSLNYVDVYSLFFPNFLVQDA